MGESKDRVLRLDFGRRLKLEFHGSKVTSDVGSLPYRGLDDTVGLTEIAGDVLTDTRRGKARLGKTRLGKNGRHGLVGQFRQSVFGRLGRYVTFQLAEVTVARELFRTILSLIDDPRPTSGCGLPPTHVGLSGVEYAWSFGHSCGRSSRPPVSQSVSSPIRFQALAPVNNPHGMHS